MSTLTKREPANQNVGFPSYLVARILILSYLK